MLRLSPPDIVLVLFQSAISIGDTWFVGHLGPAALAGYGVGIRLELLQIPLVFAVGQALVVLVGTSIGAGNPARAKTIAWTGTALAAAICLPIGATAALFPLAWVGLFSIDPAVLDAGSLYLRIVAPFYPLLGASTALYFASQGAGRMLRPVLAGTTRLAIVVLGGAVATSMATVFGIVTTGILVSAALMVWFVARAKW